MRTIDAEALKENVALMWGDNSHITESMNEIIDNAPTVDISKEVWNQSNALLEKRLTYLERPQGEWTPVSERLPEKEGFYLVFLENERMAVAHSDGIIANHDFEPKMLAWMPLPEPYMRGKEE